MQNSLFLNGLRFLLRASRDANSRGDKEVNAVFACVHAGVGLELLIKSRLVKEHWSLIYDVDGATGIPAEDEKLKTVGAKQALSRMQKLCGVQISPKHLQAIGNVLDVRNKAVHYSTEIKVEHAKSLVSRSLDIAIDLVDNELKSTSKKFLVEVKELRETSLKLDHFVKARLARISKTHDLSKAFKCPSCLHVAEVPSEIGLSCLMCGGARGWGDLQECADVSCYSCGGIELRVLGSTLIPDSDGLPDTNWHVMCPECFEEIDLIECPRCEALHEGSFFCDGCQGWADHQ